MCGAYQSGQCVVCVRACVRVCVCALREYEWECAHTCVSRVSLLACMSMYAHECVCMFARECVCMRLYACVCTFVCARAYMPARARVCKSGSVTLFVRENLRD